MYAYVPDVLMYLSFVIPAQAGTIVKLFVNPLFVIRITSNEQRTRAIAKEAAKNFIKTNRFSDNNSGDYTA